VRNAEIKKKKKRKKNRQISIAKKSGVSEAISKQGAKSGWILTMVKE